MEWESDSLCCSHIYPRQGHSSPRRHRSWEVEFRDCGAIPWLGLLFIEDRWIQGMWGTSLRWEVPVEGSQAAMEARWRCWVMHSGWSHHHSLSHTASISSWTIEGQFSSAQSFSRVRLFATPWITAHQASLSITNSRSSLRLTSIESVMLSSHLILCRPLLLLPPIPPSIRVFSNESTLRMRWPKYWSFSFSIIASKETPGLISFRMDW